MCEPVVASRAEWLRARLNLLKAEKASTRQRDDLARQQRALPAILALSLPDEAM